MIDSRYLLTAPQTRGDSRVFVDIVGSTTLASELGDDGWRRVLARFRQVVRAELRRWRGRERDTAGDGFYATFSEPARALSASASIVDAVQALGLDVRVGLHTGECEEVDGKLTGIAVHIGARVMAVAGAAEVVATRTTRDLVVGSDAEFEEARTHELKGVDGAWLLYRLVSVAQRLPAPVCGRRSGSRSNAPTVDRSQRLVRVAKRYSGGELKTGTKTVPERFVPLRQRVLDTLDAMPPRIDTRLLFPAPRGGYIDLERFRHREWTPALRAAGIDHRSICTCRHTFATWAIDSGVPPAQLAVIMGTSIRELEDTYHRWLQRLRAAFDAYDVAAG